MGVNVFDIQNGRLPKRVYNSINTDSIFWVKYIKELFESVNCADIFQNNVKIINFKEFKEYAQNKLLSCYSSVWYEIEMVKPKLHMYAKYKSDFCVEKVCKLNIRCPQMSVIAKLSVGILPITVETGLYSRTPREEHFCSFSKNSDVEDEFM